MRLEIESTVSSPISVANDSYNSVETDNLLKLGVAAAQSGDRPMARTLLSRVTEADPACVDAWLWLASISEYPEELLVFLKNVLEIEPENERALTWEAATRSLLAKTHVQRGITSHEEGNHAFALQSFDEAISFDDECEAAWYGKASLTEDENEKLDHLAKVLAINPDNADARAAVRAFEQHRSAERMIAMKRSAASGDLDTAGNLLADILAAEPDNCEAWVLRVHLAGSLEEKLDSYDRILKLDPSNAFAKYGRDFLAELADFAKLVEAADMSVYDSAPEPTEDPTAEVSDQAAQEVEIEAFVPETADESEVEATRERFEQAIAEEVYVEEPTAETPWAAKYKSEAESTEAEFASEQPQFDEDPVSLFEQDTMYFVPDEEIEAASRDTAESIDPFEQTADEHEPVSIVAEEVAREAYSYALPSAETQEFSADDHDFEETIAPEDPSELIDDTVSPSFSFQTPAPPSPWDTAAEYVEPSPSEAAAIPQPNFELAPMVAGLGCPYCAGSIERHAFACDSCHAVLSLSDIESLLGNKSVSFDAIQHSVAKMEAEWNARDFSSDELKGTSKNCKCGFAARCAAWLGHAG